MAEPSSSLPMELATTARPVSEEEAHEDSSFSLPPVDHGREAWLFLAASFVFEGLIWGFPFAFGVFQDYYSTHEPFAGSNSLAVIGTCAMGIMYLDIPLVMGLQRLYPRQSRWSPLAGLAIMSGGLVLSSFATAVPHLIAAQGVLYAVGGSVAYGPCILYLDEWFVRRKGLAYGIMWSGTGLAGVVLPLVLEQLLARYGFRTTLRVWALALVLLAAPLARWIRRRLPPAATTHLRPFNLRFVLARPFALHQAANVAQSLGYFLPAVYLPSYARAALSASPAAAAACVLLLNVAAVAGCLAMGSLIDRLHVTTCLLASAAGAAVGTLLLWGLASDLAALYAFCLVYGLFAGSYSSAYPGIMRHVASTASHDAAVDPTMVFAWLAAGRGVGNVASGPLSEALLKGMPWRGLAVAGYGSGYGPVIVFTGISALAGGCGMLWRLVGWL